MKKAIIVLLAVFALSSCAKPDKCKCSFELNTSIIDIELKDQIIQRPEDMNCSQIKVEDIKGDVVSVDLSKIGSVKCVNYND
ncbi:MAG: lipoprotein [Bacteroidales bacterium]|nr:lipoprotein [Bacteroidales bacterium]